MLNLISVYALFVVATLMGSQFAYAKLSDCINPVQVQLDPNKNVTMDFCEIPVRDFEQDPYFMSWPDSYKQIQYDIISRYPINYSILTTTYHMGQYEVTQLQYETVMGKKNWRGNGTHPVPLGIGDYYPAIYVSKHEAKLFVEKMNQIDNSATYRLPTDFEWKYAARSGQTLNFRENNYPNTPYAYPSDLDEYYWGHEPMEDYVFFANNTPDTAMDVRKCPNPQRDQIDPGYCANGYGLMHTSGNVSEMTAYSNIYGGSRSHRSPSSFYPTSYTIRTAGGAGIYILNSDLSTPSATDTLSDREVGFRIVRIPNL